MAVIGHNFSALQGESVMRTFLIPSMLLLSTLAFTSTASAETIRIGVAAEPYPPIASKDAAGAWVGFDIDLYKAVCAQMEADCELVEVAWDGLIPALQGQQIDVIWASMAHTDERAKVIDFSDKLYETPPTWIGPSNLAGNDYSDPAKLEGVIVGVQAGTTYEEFLRDTLPDQTNLRAYATVDEGLADLAAGRIDLYLGDIISGGDMLATLGGDFAIIDPVDGYDEYFGYGIAAGFRMEDDALRERVNAALADIRANGTYDAIETTHFPDINIYDPSM
jgi:polar amino acid transport system substrate-binding protein